MNKINYAHMNVAEEYAKLSYARRLKVGAIIVKDDRVISIGYNGTPSGWDNNCEDWVQISVDEYDWKTKNEVIHAEANAIAKLARSNEAGIAASMYITHAPCFECAKLIHIAGIEKVFYRNQYRNNEGINFLQKCNIEVAQI
ncbi:MAG: CMP deaminase [Alphaproteobacteria bacterium]|nr:CMP deaminase [Alphaproteobacteria bacterium]